MQVTQNSLAAAMAHWLEQNGCTVTMVRSSKTGDFEVHYTLKKDLMPQPPVRITRQPSVVFPTGSQEAVIQAWLRHCMGIQ